MDSNQMHSSTPNRIPKNQRTPPITTTTARSSGVKSNHSQSHDVIRSNAKANSRSEEPHVNDYLASFMDMVNYFNSHGRQSTKDVASPSMRSFPTAEENESQRQSNELTCPVCNQSVGSNIDELAKHLALIHLIPLPSILTCLSTSMLAASHEPQHAGPPNRPWLTTQTATPALTSSFSSQEKSLKREHSPNGKSPLSAFLINRNSKPY